MSGLVRVIDGESAVSASGSAALKRNEMLPQLFLVFRKTSMRCRSADLRCAVLNPANPVGAPLIELPHKPIQRPCRSRRRSLLTASPENRSSAKRPIQGGKNLVVVCGGMRRVRER
jgi:hypothetical protein